MPDTVWSSPVPKVSESIVPLKLPVAWVKSPSAIKAVAHTVGLRGYVK
ncbi:hypothetical protein LXM94_23915 [Rhizobium sp. TRM95111]|nr:hypothetical protein [Rhizobium alarense]MCF3643011.1 hypothetical protein [Rhizobium alarense]